MTSKGDLIKQAKENQKKSACTEFVKNEDGSEGGVYRWRPVCRTSPAKLGDLGVGIRLYFDFLYQMGLCFFVLTVLSLPMFVLNVKGNQLDESNVVNQFIGSLSVANFGACSGGACRSSEELLDRMAVADTDGLHIPFASELSKLKARDVTEWLGLLDGIGVIVFLLFGISFQYRWVPRIVRANDEQFITPADYAVQIHGLPRRLKSDHDQYEAKLKAHLQTVLQTAGVTDQNAIQEVALVRDYQGAIGKFAAQGANHMQMQEHEAQRELVQAKQKDVAKMDEAISKHRQVIESTQEALRKHSDVPDKEREVCSAFVMLNVESQQSLLLHQYRFARTGMFRLCQGKQLRFEGCRLKLAEPCEPSDLIWENLDFASWKRNLRKAVSFVAAFVVLLVCSSCLVALQSPVASDTGPTETMAWVLMNHEDSGAPCLRVCEWQLFRNQHCNAGGGDSSTWDIARMFDANGNIQSRIAADGFTDCARWWASPSCGSTGSTLARDWIAIEFSHERSVNAQVRCMQLHQPMQGAGSKFRILACRQDSLPAAGDTSTWRPEDACSPMQDVGVDVNLEDGTQIVPDTLCGTEVTYEAAEAAAEAAGGAAESVTDPSVSCFCKQQGAGVRIPPYDTPAKALCEEWSLAENWKQGILAGSILAVLVLNQILFAVLPILVQWERMCTATEIAKKQMTMIFVALFVNTGVLVLLVNWQTLGGPYDDFKPEFFPNVGSGLCMTIALQTLSNTAPQTAMAFIVSPCLACVFQRSTASQVMLDKVYQLPDWDLSLRFAQVMNVIFCILMWSGAMPILYFCGFVYCFVAYWMDKMVLLKGSRRPPMYNERVVVGAIGLFPVAALLHAMVALWVFGRQDLFPSDWSALAWLPELLMGMTRDESDQVIEEYGAVVGEAKLDMYLPYAHARSVALGRKACWLLCLIFLFFVALYVVRFLWSYFLRPFCNPLEVLVRECCRSCCRRKKEGDEHAVETPFAEERENMKREGKVYSYKIEGNDRYADVTQALRHSHVAPPPAAPTE